MMLGEQHRRRSSPESSRRRRKERRDSRELLQSQQIPMPMPPYQERSEPDPTHTRSRALSSSSSSSSTSSSLLNISRPSRKFGLGAFFSGNGRKHRRRVKKKRSSRFLRFGNSSSSSVGSDLAYGRGYIDRRRSREFSPPSTHRPRRSGTDQERPAPPKRAQTDEEIIELGRKFAEIARQQNIEDIRASGRTRPSTLVGAASAISQFHRTSSGNLERGIGSSKPYRHSSPDDSEWESASEDESSSEDGDSGLAYGSAIKLPSKPSNAIHLTSSNQYVQHVNYGISIDRNSSAVDPKLFGPVNSLRGHVQTPCGFEKVDRTTLSESRQLYDPSVAPSETVSSESRPLQQVYPVPTSDPTRFDVGRGSVVSAQQELTSRSRPAPVPIQQPKPIAPVSARVFETTDTDPRYSRRTSSGSVLAKAAVAGVAGAAIGAALSSDRKEDDVKYEERRDCDEKRRSRHSEPLIPSLIPSERDDKRKSRDDPRDDRHAKRREKEPDVGRDHEREKRRREKKEPEGDREIERETRRRDKHRDDADSILERERRREERKEERKDGRKSDRRESRKEERREENRPIRSIDSETYKRLEGADYQPSKDMVDPFQFQVLDDAFKTPEYATPNRPLTPNVFTVEREPDFSRLEFTDDKDHAPERSSRRDSYEREARDAREAYKATEHATAPLSGAAFAAAAAVIIADDRRGRSRGRGGDSSSRNRSRQGDSPPRVRDPVLEDADKTFREQALARRIETEARRSRSNSPEPSVVDKWQQHDDSPVIEIVTPPQMDHPKKTSRYDKPDADVRIDNVLEHPEQLHRFQIPDSRGPSRVPVFSARDPSAERERPMLNIVWPTPVSSPKPEKQRRQDESAPESRKRVVVVTSKSDPDFVIGPRGEAASTPSTPTSKVVSWGENQTKHYVVESPEREEDPYSGRKIITPAETAQSRPAKKSGGWGMIAAAVSGIGAGAAASSISDSAVDTEKARQRAEVKDRGTPSKRRSSIQYDDIYDSPPVPGPKPPSPRSTQMPGAFAEDPAFMANIAAGLEGSGFDPNIVINDANFHRRDSPPGMDEPSMKSLADLDITVIPDTSTSRGDQESGFVLGELPETPAEEKDISTYNSEIFSKLTKKERRKQEKAGKRESVDKSSTVVTEEPPAVSSRSVAEDEWAVPSSKLSKKGQKKRDKAAKAKGWQDDDQVNDSIASPQPEPEPAEIPAVDEWEDSSSKKKSKKSKKAIVVQDEPQSFENTESSQVSIPVDAFQDLQDANAVLAEDEWDLPKKSKKKSKRESGTFESGPSSVVSVDRSRKTTDSDFSTVQVDERDNDEIPSQDSWAYASPPRSVPASELSREGSYKLVDADTNAAPEDEWDLPKKSKKKSKRDSGAYDSPSRSAPASETSVESSRKPTEPDFDSGIKDEWDLPKKSKKSKRNSVAAESPLQSTTPTEVSEGKLARRHTSDENPAASIDNNDDWDMPKKSKKKSKRDSGAWDTMSHSEPATSEIVESPKEMTDPSNDLRSEKTAVAEDEWDVPKKSKKKSKRDSTTYEDSPTPSASQSAAPSEVSVGSSKKKSRRDSYADSPSRSAPASEIGIEDAEKKRKKEKRRSAPGGFPDDDDFPDDEEPPDRGRDPFKFLDSDVTSVVSDSTRRHRSSRSRGVDEFDDAKSVASAPGGPDRKDRKSSKSDKDKRSSGSSGFFDRFKSSIGIAEEKERSRSRKPEEDKKNSFLDNAGALGASAGLTGAAIALATQAFRSKATDPTTEEEARSIPTTPKRRSSSPPAVEFIDPEIVEREIRPAIDPQYGDLLPLPPSTPGSTVPVLGDDIPPLPESRPGTPENERERLLLSDKPTHIRRRSDTSLRVKTPSQSAIPIQFRLGQRTPLSSPGNFKSSPMVSPTTGTSEQGSASKSRSRPISWESSKAFKPLLLVQKASREPIDTPTYSQQDLPPSELSPGMPRPELDPSEDDEQSLSRSPALPSGQGQEVTRTEPAAGEFGLSETTSDIEKAPRPVENIEESSATPKEEENLRADDVLTLPTLPQNREAPVSELEQADEAELQRPLDTSLESPELPPLRSSEDASGESPKPEPIDSMSKDRSSHLLRSSPLASQKSQDVDLSEGSPTLRPAQKAVDLGEIGEDIPEEDLKGSSVSAAAAGVIAGGLAATAMLDHQHRNELTGKQESFSSPSLETKDTNSSDVALEGGFPQPNNASDVANSAAQGNAADEFSFLPAKKSKKGKKGKGKSTEVEDVTPVLAGPETPAQEEVVHSGETSDQVQNSSQIDEEVATSKLSKKEKKKKKKAQSWEPGLDESASAEALPSTSPTLKARDEELIDAPAHQPTEVELTEEQPPEVQPIGVQPTEEQNPEEATTDASGLEGSLSTSSKKGKKKKNRKSQAWEPELDDQPSATISQDLDVTETSTQPDEDHTPPSESLAEPVEHPESEPAPVSPAPLLERSMSVSKKGKKKKGKKVPAWEEEDVAPATPGPEPTPAAEDSIQEPFTQPDEDHIPPSETFTEPVNHPEPELGPESTAPLLGRATSVSKKGKKKKGTKVSAWEEEVVTPATLDPETTLAAESPILEPFAEPPHESTVDAQPTIQNAPEITTLEGPPATETTLADEPVFTTKKSRKKKGKKVQSWEPEPEPEADNDVMSAPDSTMSQQDVPSTQVESSVPSEEGGEAVKQQISSRPSSSEPGTMLPDTVPNTSETEVQPPQLSDEMEVPEVTPLEEHRKVTEFGPGNRSTSPAKMSETGPGPLADELLAFAPTSEQVDTVKDDQPGLEISAVQPAAQEDPKADENDTIPQDAPTLIHANPSTSDQMGDSNALGQDDVEEQPPNPNSPSGEDKTVLDPVRTGPPGDPLAEIASENLQDNPTQPPEAVGESTSSQPENISDKAPPALTKELGQSAAEEPRETTDWQEESGSKKKGKKNKKKQQQQQQRENSEPFEIEVPLDRSEPAAVVQEPVLEAANVDDQPIDVTADSGAADMPLPEATEPSGDDLWPESTGFGKKSKKGKKGRKSSNVVALDDEPNPAGPNDEQPTGPEPLHDEAQIPSEVQQEPTGDDQWAETAGWGKKFKKKGKKNRPTSDAVALAEEGESSKPTDEPLAVETALDSTQPSVDPSSGPLAKPDTTADNQPSEVQPEFEFMAIKKKSKKDKKKRGSSQIDLDVSELPTEIPEPTAEELPNEEEQPQPPTDSAPASSETPVEQADPDTEDVWSNSKKSKKNKKRQSQSQAERDLTSTVIETNIESAPGQSSTLVEPAQTPDEDDSGFTSTNAKKSKKEKKKKRQSVQFADPVDEPMETSAGPVSEATTPEVSLEPEQLTSMQESNKSPHDAMISHEQPFDADLASDSKLDSVKSDDPSDQVIEDTEYRETTDVTPEATDDSQPREIAPTSVPDESMPIEGLTIRTLEPGDNPPDAKAEAADEQVDTSLPTDQPGQEQDPTDSVKDNPEVEQMAESHGSSDTIAREPPRTVDEGETQPASPALQPPESDELAQPMDATVPTDTPQTEEAASTQDPTPAVADEEFPIFEKKSKKDKKKRKNKGQDHSEATSGTTTPTTEANTGASTAEQIAPSSSESPPTVDPGPTDAIPSTDPESKAIVDDPPQEDDFPGFSTKKSKKDKKKNKRGSKIQEAAPVATQTEDVDNQRPQSPVQIASHIETMEPSGLPETSTQEPDLPQPEDHQLSSSVHEASQVTTESLDPLGFPTQDSESQPPAPLDTPATTQNEDQPPPSQDDHGESVESTKPGPETMPETDIVREESHDEDGTRQLDNSTETAENEEPTAEPSGEEQPSDFIVTRKSKKDKKKKRGTLVDDDISPKDPDVSEPAPETETPVTEGLSGAVEGISEDAEAEKPAHSTIEEPQSLNEATADPQEASTADKDFAVEPEASVETSAKPTEPLADQATALNELDTQLSEWAPTKKGKKDKKKKRASTWGDEVPQQETEPQAPATADAPTVNEQVEVGTSAALESPKEVETAEFVSTKKSKKDKKKKRANLWDEEVPQEDQSQPPADTTTAKPEQLKTDNPTALELNKDEDSASFAPAKKSKKDKKKQRSSLWEYELPQDEPSQTSAELDVTPEVGGPVEVETPVPESSKDKDFESFAPAKISKKDEKKKQASLWDDQLISQPEPSQEAAESTSGATPNEQVDEPPAVVENSREEDTLGFYSGKKNKKDKKNKRASTWEPEPELPTSRQLEPEAEAEPETTTQTSHQEVIDTADIGIFEPQPSLSTHDLSLAEAGLSVGQSGIPLASTGGVGEVPASIVPDTLSLAEEGLSTERSVEPAEQDIVREPSPDASARTLDPPDTEGTTAMPTIEEPIVTDTQQEDSNVSLNKLPEDIAPTPSSGEQQANTSMEEAKSPHPDEQPESKLDIVSHDHLPSQELAPVQTEEQPADLDEWAPGTSKKSKKGKKKKKKQASQLDLEPEAEIATPLEEPQAQLLSSEAPAEDADERPDEQPAVEETAVEETAVEETAVEETAVEETAVEETAVEETAVEETAVEEPAVEEPVAEELSRIPGDTAIAEEESPAFLSGKKDKKDKKKKRASQLDLEPEAEIATPLEEPPQPQLLSSETPAEDASERLDDQPAVEEPGKILEDTAIAEEEFPAFLSGKKSKKKKRQSQVDWEVGAEGELPQQDPQQPHQPESTSPSDPQPESQAAVEDTSAIVKDVAEPEEASLGIDSSKKSKKKKGVVQFDWEEASGTVTPSQSHPEPLLPDEPPTEESPPQLADQPTVEEHAASRDGADAEDLFPGFAPTKKSKKEKRKSKKLPDIESVEPELPVEVETLAGDVAPDQAEQSREPLLESVSESPRSKSPIRDIQDFAGIPEIPESTDQPSAVEAYSETTKDLQQGVSESEALQTEPLDESMRDPTANINTSANVSNNVHAPQPSQDPPVSSQADSSLPSQNPPEVPVEEFPEFSTKKSNKKSKKKGKKAQILGAAEIETQKPSDIEKEDEAATLTAAVAPEDHKQVDILGDDESNDLPMVTSGSLSTDQQNDKDASPSKEPEAEAEAEPELELFPVSLKKSKKDKKKKKAGTQLNSEPTSGTQTPAVQDISVSGDLSESIPPLSTIKEPEAVENEWPDFNTKKSKKDKKRRKASGTSTPLETFQSFSGDPVPEESQEQPSQEQPTLEEISDVGGQTSKAKDVWEDDKFFKPKEQVDAIKEPITHQLNSPEPRENIPDIVEPIEPVSHPRTPSPNRPLSVVVDLSPAQLSSHVEHERPFDQSTQPGKKVRTQLAEDDSVVPEPLSAPMAEFPDPNVTDLIHNVPERAPMQASEASPSKPDSIEEDAPSAREVAATLLESRPGKSDKKKKSKGGDSKDVETAITAAAAAGGSALLAETSGGSKKGKGKKKLKYVDKRTPNEDDIFDDPALWESSERKPLEEGSRMDDDAGDFWTGPSTDAGDHPGDSSSGPTDIAILDDKAAPPHISTEAVHAESPVAGRGIAHNLPDPHIEHQQPPMPREPATSEIIDNLDDLDTSEHLDQRRDSLSHEPEQSTIPTRTHDFLDHGRASPRILPPVEEETHEDLENEFRSSAQDTPSKFMASPEVNRDSGFVPDSPHPLRRSLIDEPGLRDSGVHMRDWPESTPKKGESPSGSEESGARLSWPTGENEGSGSRTPRGDEKRSRRSLLGNETPRLGTPARHGQDGWAETPENQTTDPKKPRSAKYQDLGRAALATPQRSEQRSFSDNISRESSPRAERQGRRSASNTSISRLRTPEPLKLRPDSPGSHTSHISHISHSGRSNATSTPPLRRVDKRMSGDLRSLNQPTGSNPNLSSLSLSEAVSSAKLDKDKDRDRDRHNTTPVANEGRVRAKDMTDVYDGLGEGRIGSPRSPTRPHSMRRRQSMQVLELESKVEQLIAENRSLADARAQAERNLSQRTTSAISERDAEIENLRASLDWLRNEVTRLTEVNEGLHSANNLLALQHNDKYGRLETQHASAARELEEHRGARGQYTRTLQEKDAEIEELRNQLEAAKGQIREMQKQILAAKPPDAEFLRLKDEDHFDHRCQQLCSHVQQWVLRFSKFSDMRACRLASEINDEKIIDRLDNSILDGSDVDKFLSDRVRRRDIFMSMTMNMIWEFVFTRYLFGMDREQRQKLKSLEKLLTEVGPPQAVRQWRAVTLTLLSKRPAFGDQRNQDTEAVVQAIFQTLSMILPPPSNLESQIQSQLRRVMREAVDLSIEMRTQRAEYMMLPPLQPEYDANGELTETVTFNASLMNERSGDSTSNEELEAQGAVVRSVLFPLVVKKGDDSGVGDDEIVVCPAQVLVAKARHSTRMVTPSSEAGGVPLSRGATPSAFGQSTMSVNMTDAPLPSEGGI
ncbi:Uu.00g045190.m01.CDS01 [Anthostomella pinea]|uniref:Uu.00g045190.m01.CDS01 n=1 Tax=Anthostomella pinea TaxID=933095 RepID=A0AAI8VB46_9PEZI|nr:Uu.00g045190.m01.CDS01 [Anthostomella pinea]